MRRIVLHAEILLQILRSAFAVVNAILIAEFLRTIASMAISDERLCNNFLFSAD